MEAVTSGGKMRETEIAGLSIAELIKLQTQLGKIIKQREPAPDPFTIYTYVLIKREIKKRLR
jgi:hypothetical protein